MILQAPAKLNLTLEVLNRRDDGYHNLRSVMVPVTLADEIEIDSGGPPGFESSDPALGRENLIERALAAIGLAEAPLRVRLCKRIPVGAGLGGGSSDAAAILLAAAEGHLGAVPHADYLSLAARLGSDVPFFLCGTAAIVEAAGERLTALGALPPWGATIVRPPVAVSTARAYAMLDGKQRDVRPRNTSLTLECAQALQRADFAGVTACLHNDFETAVAGAYPEIAQALALLGAWSSSPALLTGSGSCVFTLWETAAPEGPLALPPGYERYDVGFAQANAWRPHP